MAAPTDESLGQLARQIAEDAARLVRAEIEMAKQEAKAFIWRIAAGACLLLAGLASAALFAIFLLGTLDEARSAYDDWPMGAAVGCLLLGALFGGMAAKFKSIAPVAAGLAGAFVLGFAGWTIYFFVSIFIGGQTRIGWAVTALTFFVAIPLTAGPGMWLIWRGIKRGKTIPGSVREDVVWFKHLTKRNANGS